MTHLCLWSRDCIMRSNGYSNTNKFEKNNWSLPCEFIKLKKCFTIQYIFNILSAVTLKIDPIEKWPARGVTFQLLKFDRSHFSTVWSHFSTLKSDLFWLGSLYNDQPYLLEIGPPVEIWPPVKIWSHVNFLLMERNQTSFKYWALCASLRGYKNV